MREIGPHIAVIGCPYKVALLEILGTPPESLERLAKMYWAATGIHFDKNSSIDKKNINLKWLIFSYSKVLKDALKPRALNVLP